MIKSGPPAVAVALIAISWRLGSSPVQWMTMRTGSPGIGIQHQPVTGAWFVEYARGPALALLIIGATFAAYGPAIQAGFTWDDDILLYQNPLILKSDGLRRIWFTTEAPDYWPLSATTFWIEWRMWGSNPKPYHITNIAFHALAAVILWRIMKRLNVGGLGAFLAGLLFAIHPVAVESVAWISERKNVVSMVLYLLAILAYLRFEDERRHKWYVLALLAAAAAMLAKASVVMLPIVLLLLIWWQRNSLSRWDILRTAPIFLMSLVFGLLTIWFQHQSAVADVVARPEGLASRIASVGWVVWFYLYKIVLPTHLAMIYPRWDVDGGRILSYLPLAVLIGCFVVLWWCRRGWGRAPLVASASFVIVLAPVLGLLDMSYAVYSLVADHLQYPGMPAVLALIAAGLGAEWSRARRGRHAPSMACVAAVIGVILATLGVLTWRQAQVYRSELTLWSQTIEANDRAWTAFNSRGVAWLQMGDLSQAIVDLTKAIEIRPDYAIAYNNRANAYSAQGDFAQALRDCDKAIELKPTYAEAYNNRGITHMESGHLDQALRDCTRAIQFKPDFAEAWYNCGSIYIGSGADDEAIHYYTRAIELKPDYAEAYNNRGVAFGRKGEPQRALQDHSKTVELKPGFAQAYINRATDHFSLGQYDQARADVEKFRQLGGEPNPEFVKALEQAAGRSEPASELKVESGK